MTEQHPPLAVDETAMVADLTALVSFPSAGGSLAEERVQRWGAEALRWLGGRVEQWEDEVATLAREPDWPGQEVDRQRIHGVVARFGPQEGEPALVLCGHTDVVPAADPSLWAGQDPWTVQPVGQEEDWTGLGSSDAPYPEGLRYVGRGVTDMKGGVAAILAAVRAVQSSGVTLRRPLAVHLVSGEEDGGAGTFATLRRGHTGEACVIAEPTAGQLITANAGSLTFRLTVRGRAAHGAMAGQGVNALTGLRVVQDALEDLQAERLRGRPAPFDTLDDPWPLSIGIVRGGDWASTVLDELVVEGRFGVRPDETPAEARAALEECVAAACAADPFLRERPVEVEWPGGVFAPGRLPADHELGEQMADAVEAVSGTRPGQVGAPYGSDLRQYAAAGVPTLQYGPGDIQQAHSVDEWVEHAELVRCARAFAQLVVTRCC